MVNHILMLNKNQELRVINILMLNLCLDSSFEVTLAVDYQSPVLVNETDEGRLLFHTTNLTQPYQTVVIAVYPVVNESLNVYIKFGMNPSTDDVDYFIQVSKSHHFMAYQNKQMNDCFITTILFGFKAST